MSFKIYDGKNQSKWPTKPTMGVNIEGSAGDWAQNDENGAGYIANRTHWAEASIQPVLKYEWQGEKEGFGFYTGEQIIRHNEGKTHRVIINGKEYEGVCVLCADDPLEPAGYYRVELGDGFWLTEGTGNGSSTDLNGGDPRFEWRDIKIFTIEEVETVHTLDEKYLPKESGFFYNFFTIFHAQNTTNTYVSDCDLEKVGSGISGGIPVLVRIIHKDNSVSFTSNVRTGTTADHSTTELVVTEIANGYYVTYELLSTGLVVVEETSFQTT